MAFFIIHFVGCFILTSFMLAKVLKVNENIYAAIVFLPIVGFVILLIQKAVEWHRISANKEIGLEKMKVDNVRFMHIKMSDDQNEDLTVPLEEAMIINDASTRRKLLMEVLQKDPSKHVELLMVASNSEDTELTHYATTTMMEVQTEFETSIKRLTDELDYTNHKDRVLVRLRQVLTEFIKSGLLTGTILRLYQTRLENVLQQLCKIYPEQKVYTMELASIYLDLGKTESVKEILDNISGKWPMDEDVFQLKVDYYAACGQGEKIQEVVQEMKEKGVYLSADGRQWMEFWDCTK